MAITYDGQAIPGTLGSSTLHLTGIHRIEKVESVATVTFRFVVDSPTELALATDCLAIEELFQTLRRPFAVTLLGNTSITLDDADYSGIEVTPEISKPGEEDPRFDTNTSRLYEVTITAGLPAITDDADGLRSFGYAIDYTPSRIGSLVVSGVYTGIVSPLTSSIAAYQAGVTARVATILAALGWTAELVNETLSVKQGEGETAFTRTYRQVRYEQGSSTLDMPQLVDPILIVSVAQPESEDDPTASPALNVVAEYATSVDFDLESDLRALWENTVLPYIQEEMQLSAGGSIAIEEATPKFNWSAHSITALVSGVSIQAGALLSRRVVTKDKVDYGKVIRYVWPEQIPEDEEADQPEASRAYVYVTARTITRTVETTTETSGGVAPGGGAVIGAPRRVLHKGADAFQELEAPEVPTGTTAVLLTRDSDYEVRSKGLPGQQIPIQVRTVVEVYELVSLIESGAAGGGGPPNPNPKGFR